MSWSSKSKGPGEAYERGAKVKAKVLHIDVENEKFSLGIKQLSEDPWDRAEKQCSPGSRMTGKIVRIADFGAFVEVMPEVEGLVHISEIADEKVEDIRSYLQEGQEVEVEVTNFDSRDRKLSLSMKAVKRRERDKEMKKYLDNSDSLSSSLGDAFKKS
jgi:small subunit ribosomal protein S1